MNGEAPYLAVAVETVVASASAAALVLVVQRYRLDGRRRDLLLALALTAVTAANAFTWWVAVGQTTVVTDRLHAAAAAAAGTGAHPGPQAVLRLVAGVGLLAAAHLWRPRRAHRPDPAVTLAAVVAVLLTLLVAYVVVARGLLGPVTSSSPVSIAATLDLLTAVAWGAASIGFARAWHHERDPLQAWLVGVAVVGNLALLVRVVSPSPSDVGLVGEVLRAGAFLTLAAGALHALTGSWREQVRHSVEEERRRLARDLHDGVAQDVAFIATEVRRLVALDRARLTPIAAAADHALDEARWTLDGLVGPPGRPLLHALLAVAEPIADRAGARVTVHGTDHLVARPEVTDQLTRIVGEAVGNAVRHGGATFVEVQVHGPDPVRVVIADDGCGFEPSAVRASAHGLVGMRERVAAIGGSLRIDTGRDGTVVEVRL